jgi:hypothetical protein
MTSTSKFKTVVVGWPDAENPEICNDDQEYALQNGARVFIDIEALAEKEKQLEEANKIIELALAYCDGCMYQSAKAKLREYVETLNKGKANG